MEKLKYGPYSPSRLETATCGYAFRLQYIDIDKTKPKKLGSLPQERGSAVHEVLEQITKKMCENPHYSFTENEVRTWVVEAITKYPTAYIETQQVLDMARLYIARPPRMLTLNAETELRLAVKFCSTRQNFIECDYDDPDAFGRGRADIFMISDDTTIAYVIDHKTQANVEEADTFQMGFYAWVIWKIYPFLQEIRTILHFAKFGKYSQEYTWTIENLQRIEDELVTRVAIVEARTNWGPVPHKNCIYCEHIVECPALREYIEIDENLPLGFRAKLDNLKILGDTNKAVKIAGAVYVAEQFLDEAKDQLKEHVKNTSPVAIPGRVFMFKPSEKVDWDKANKHQRDALYEVFQKHNVDPRSYMSFNQTASAAVWLESNPELVEDLKAILKTKISTTFSGHKV